MYCADVNVLVYAFVKDSPFHEPCAKWIQEALTEPRAVALPMSVLSGFLRITTSRRVRVNPSSPDLVTDFIDWVLAHPGTFVPGSDRRDYALARTLIREQGLTGDDIPDAMLAATALGLGATLVTADRGFRRFADLSLLDPTAS